VYDFAINDFGELSTLEFASLAACQKFVDAHPDAVERRKSALERRKFNRTRLYTIGFQEYLALFKDGEGTAT
jgi:hypothetical protein